MKNLLILFTAFLMSCGSDEGFQVGDKTYKFDKITNNVYVMHGPLAEPNEENEGFMNNPSFVIGNKGLVVVDPGGSYQTGKKILNEIAKISDLPIVAVFNTHIHGDHWLGNQAILEKYPNVIIYAHPEMIKQAKAGGGDNWVDLMERLTKGKTKGTIATYPNAETRGNDIITAAGMKFKIHKPTAFAHTDSDMMIEHKESKTLFAGDNLFANRFGQFDTTSKITENIKALEYAKDLKLNHYIPGHGPSGGVEKVDVYLEYLNIIIENATKAYDEGLEGYEIKESVEKQLSKYHNWSGYDVNLGRHLAKAILEIEAMDF
jgi:glyoxylase-like metal-dependent hydrolase (beta-lactamase superfamily II)